MHFCARLTEMSEQKPGEALREYLDRRETELQIGINALHDQLRPQESELAEIRRAKGALGIPILHLVVSHSGASLEIETPSGVGTSAPSEQKALLVDAVVTVPAVTLTASAVTAGRPQISSPELTTDMMMSSDTPLPLRMSTYQHLTMKQLVVKALKEHFPDGATAKQLREFIRDAWNRDIERANLSPQLSRLHGEDILEWRDGIWSLKKQETIKRRKV
jgi:hypothetical protein